jgi:serine/threonine protein phosphatase PrpC
MRLASWSLSDIGRKRDHNEDSLLDDDQLHLYAVADGMGGHQGGDHASRLAVEVLRREVALVADYDVAARDIVQRDPMAVAFPRDLAQALQTTDVRPRPDPAAPQVVKWAGLNANPPSGTGDDTFEELSDMPTDPNLQVVPPAAATILRSAARVAGRAIYDAAQGDTRLSGMGTTLTALLFHKDRAHLVHVGDSRAFLFRDGRMFQVTDDHSWIAEQVRAGVLSVEDARESKFRHIITRSVGFEREVDVDVLGVPIVPGDCFLLCSDGMSNYVDNDELGRILATTYYCRVPQLLVDLANDRGGDDNITVVLIYVANDKSR